MSDIKDGEKRKIEKFFFMGSGYVDDFTNSSFRKFVKETLEVDIYTEQFSMKGESKANRLRTLWAKESNYRVGILLKAMLERWAEKRLLSFKSISDPEKALYDECLKVANRLMEEVVVDEIDVFKEVPDNKDMSLLVTSIRASIEKNQPEVALDRLHTYVTKYFRDLCRKHNINFSNRDSLNAVYGKYVKYLIEGGKIESEMSKQILKYAISIIEAFNTVRNSQSFAHDNPILNYGESRLIFNNIANALKFIEGIENLFDEELRKVREEEDDENDNDEFDFTKFFE